MKGAEGAVKKRKQAQGILPEPVEMTEATFGEILSKWQSWYPFALNDSPEDREQREQVEIGLRSVEKLETLHDLAMLACHAHLERLPEVQKTCQVDPAAREAWGKLRQARCVALSQEKIASELETIQNAAREIPEFVIEGLLEVAGNAIRILDTLTAQYPDGAKNSARGRLSWPVLVSQSRKEFSVIQERLSALHLGEGVSKPADVKASDSTARCYAVAVYETLSENKELHVRIRKLYEDPDFRDMPVNSPRWATGSASLPKFKRKHFAKWWRVAEAMLKDQCADLVDRPEWANTTRHSICRTDFGELRRGTAQSRILEKIKDALFNLASD